MKKKLAVGFAATALLALSACGGGRPSVGDISDALQDNSNEVTSEFAAETDEETADCIAEVLHGSDLSDETLRAFVDGDEDYEPDDDDSEEAAFEAIQEDFFECITANIEVPE